MTSEPVSLGHKPGISVSGANWECSLRAVLPLCAFLELDWSGSRQIPAYTPPQTWCWPRSSLQTLWGFHPSPRKGGWLWKCKNTWTQSLSAAVIPSANLHCFSSWVWGWSENSRRGSCFMVSTAAKGLWMQRGLSRCSWWWGGLEGEGGVPKHESAEVEVIQ